MGATPLSIAISISSTVGLIAVDHDHLPGRDEHVELEDVRPVVVALHLHEARNTLHYVTLHETCAPSSSRFTYTVFGHGEK